MDIKRCPICGARAKVCGPVSSCHVCDHVFQTEPVVEARYDAEYIKSRYDAYPTTEAMSYLRVGFLRAHVTPGNLLDVGYGNGSFVKAALKCGYKAYGADLHGCDYGVEERPLNSMAEYQVVTFFDSLEHFVDFDAVRSLFTRTQYVLVSFPCRPAWFPGDLGWKHYRPGEHLHYFSTLSLSRLLSRFQVVDQLDLEDTIRGKLGRGEQNIETMLFKRFS